MVMTMLGIYLILIILILLVLKGASIHERNYCKNCGNMVLDYVYVYDDFTFCTAKCKERFLLEMSKSLMTPEERRAWERMSN